MKRPVITLFLLHFHFQIHLSAGGSSLTLTYYFDVLVFSSTCFALFRSLCFLRRHRLGRSTSCWVTTVRVLSGFLHSPHVLKTLYLPRWLGHGQHSRHVRLFNRCWSQRCLVLACRQQERQWSFRLARRARSVRLPIRQLPCAVSRIWT